MVLFSRARGGLIPKNQLRDRFARFVHGDWVALLRESQEAAEEATTSRCRRRRTQVDSIERRAERPQALVAIGEISSGRSALEGDPIAPGNEATLTAHVANHRPVTEFDLDRDRFLKNLRSAKRRTAAGPSGMTSEHLRPFLDSVRDSELLWDLGRSFARGQVPAEILPLIRLGRITALRKPSGGIRGIVVGDVFRRFVA